MSSAKDRIVMPCDDRHYMVISNIAHEVVAFHSTAHSTTNATSRTVIARSRSAIQLKENYRAYSLDPVYYFPEQAIQTGLLKKNKKTTYCPLKGHTEYFDLSIAGTTIRNAAWSYRTITHEDPRVLAIRNRVAFDTSLIDIDFDPA